MPLIQAPFRASKKLYAFNPESFTVEASPGGNGFMGHRYSLEAIWFTRRSNGKRAAVIGELWDHSNTRYTPQPWGLAEFIEQIHTARYGGTPGGVWDGNVAWWGSGYADDGARQAAVLPHLQHQLANYPAIPAGYQGWYLLQD
jgi:hypothetical protein